MGEKQAERSGDGSCRPVGEVSGQSALTPTCLDIWALFGPARL